MDHNELTEKRARLLVDLANLPPGQQGTREWERREEILADIRNVNQAIKAENRAKFSNGRAARNTKRRSNAKPRTHKTTGEFLLWQAEKVRQTLCSLKHPLPFTVEFAAALDKFYYAQANHVLEYSATHGSPTWASTKSEWSKTWSESSHHGSPDIACPACGTDSTTGCLQDGPNG